MTFNEIWITHKNYILNFIKTKVKDEHIANDILQEVGVKLHQSLAKKTAIKNYKNWLFQVTRNTIADYYRKHKKHAELTNYQSKANSDPNICICDLSGFVIKNYLPEEYGTPLYLSDIEQKPQKEIAKTLNLSLTATKSRIQRGRKKLKEMVSECIDISYNNRGQITDLQLKKNCNLPKELKHEIERINLIP
ncbi:sigma-70 family RNA polymerase sigma factor [Tenacibaculum caenipelagi]|uniref:RNA polymerase sigma (SigZ) subunit n=1 Tax=Tenacibaculum caenipelagi TaxID=1325435 RepID=A0A4R6THC1_9FLAO|nr:sigma-70 family RNA polymerase sigma factor [Tenacibaculum caenipelagi]TDQ29983.1 RNA polymerase sigma (SigZ) subunit [Tenacibaculum caenipelagi]